MPRTGTGKILHRVLRDRYGHWSTRKNKTKQTASKLQAAIMATTRFNRYGADHVQQSLCPPQGILVLAFFPLADDRFKTSTP